MKDIRAHFIFWPLKKKSYGIEASRRPTWFRNNSAQFKNPHIVVLGAGFGGLTFCQTLNRSAARLTLVDRQNHHLFQPLLYQVATSGLSAPEIAQPIRSILSNQPNVTVLLDHVTGFDLAAKTVRLGKNTLTSPWAANSRLNPPDRAADETARQQTRHCREKENSGRTPKAFGAGRR